jgi:hypothetical protein
MRSTLLSLALGLAVLAALALPPSEARANWGRPVVVGYPAPAYYAPPVVTRGYYAPTVVTTAYYPPPVVTTTWYAPPVVYRRYARPVVYPSYYVAPAYYPGW